MQESGDIEQLEQQRKAVLVRRLLVVVVVVVLLVTAVSFAVPRVLWTQRLTALATVAAALAGMKLVDDDRGRTAGTVTVVLTQLVGASALLNDPTSSLYTGAFAVSIVTAGIVLSRRGTVVAGAVAASAVLGVHLAQHLELLVLRRNPEPLAISAMQATVLATITVLMYWNTTGLAETLSRMLRAHHELKRSETRYQAIFSQARDGIVVLDASGVILVANPAAVQMLDLDEDCGAGTTLGESLIQVISTADDSGTLLLEGDDGIPRRLTVWSGPFSLPDGGLGTQVMLRDLSELDRANAAREELRMQLLQAQKMEALGRLAGGVAHDFNNLLMVVVNHAELLLESGQDAATSRSLRAITMAAERGEALTAQLSAFGRKRPGNAEDVSLDHLITDFSDMLRRMVGEHVELRFLLEAPQAIRAAPGQLQQVLANLAINASHAMPSGGVLTLRTAVDGSDVVLHVVDDGAGMDETTRRRVFEPFFTTKEVGKGTGLGLAVVHGIVLQAGGSVSVTSQLGHGTAFRLRFPMVDGAPTWKPTTDRTPPSLWPLTGRSVLLVDDDIDVGRTTAAILELAGARVIPATDATSALDALEHHRASIDIVLTDVVMPGRSGPMLVSAMRDAGYDGPVVYMSGYSDASHSPDEVLLQKPVAAGLLTKTLSEALS